MDFTPKQFCEYILKNGGAEHWIQEIRNPIWSVVINLGEGCDVNILMKWCKNNCHGKYDVYSGYYVVFELEEDAIGFKLCWI